MRLSLAALALAAALSAAAATPLAQAVARTLLEPLERISHLFASALPRR